MPTEIEGVETESSSSPSMAGEIPRFEVGQEYRRKTDIHLKYGGSWQNGISSSAVCPAVFVFTGESGEQYGYRDGFDSAGVFSYSGEGQTGNMEFKSGNRALRDHAKEGRAVYLFQALGKGKPCRYLGEFAVANHTVVRGPDREGHERNIIVFHMLEVPAPAAGDVASQAEVTHEVRPLAEARQRALAACSASDGPAGRLAVQTLYARSKAVRDYVLQRANGACEGCRASAPFLALDGTPYLEAHHVNRLSDGGIDHPRYVAALCPACHRRVHYGQDGAQLNTKLVEWLELCESLR